MPLLMLWHLRWRTRRSKVESTKPWQATEEMAGDQFRVQELNLLLGWHLHTTAGSLKVALKEAKRITRKTHVLSEDGGALNGMDPLEHREPSLHALGITKALDSEFLP